MLSVKTQTYLGTNMIQNIKSLNYYCTLLNNIFRCKHFCFVRNSMMNNNKHSNELILLHDWTERKLSFDAKPLTFKFGWFFWPKAVNTIFTAFIKSFVSANYRTVKCKQRAICQQAIHFNEIWTDFFLFVFFFLQLWQWIWITKYTK